MTTTTIPDTVKALTLWQPWASLCVITNPEAPVPVAPKNFETRSWGTSYRGPLLIHSAKRWRKEQQSLCWESDFEEALMEMGGYSGPKDLPRGEILGIVTLEAIHRAEDVAQVLKEGATSPCGPPELSFGDFSAGRKAWKLEMPLRFSKPMPWRGSQGLWEMPTSELPDVAQRYLEDPASIYDLKDRRVSPAPRI